MIEADAPAFPAMLSSWTDDRDGTTHHNVTDGLTARGYIAIEAMSGLLANSTTGIHRIPKNLAREAVEYADALIAELNKDGPLT